MKVLRWLDEYLEEYLLVFLSGLTVIVVFYQVFMRFVVGNSSSWSEELARYAFIWLIFIGLSYGVKKQKHITVDVFTFLKPRSTIILNIIASAFFLYFSLIVAYYGFNVTMASFESGRLTPGLHIPMGFVYLAAPVGMVLTSIRIIQHIWKQVSRLKTGELDVEIGG